MEATVHSHLRFSLRISQHEATDFVYNMHNWRQTFQAIKCCYCLVGHKLELYDTLNNLTMKKGL